MRRRFGSSVHFSPSPSAKEFFLVVSFSFASFPLSEESVALALKCCICGDHAGFRVFKLSDHRFRFSVASNKVGHFIYGLKDRVWPDFICHFQLFRGDTARSVEMAADFWLNSVKRCHAPISGSIAVRTNLDFLKGNAQVTRNNLVSDASGARDKIHFGEIIASLPVASSGDLPQHINFGSFSCDLFLPNQRPALPHVIGHSFKKAVMSEISNKDLWGHILDLRQANYTDQDIMASLNIPWVPLSEVILASMGRCSKCYRDGHLEDACPGPFCHTCNALGHSWRNCTLDSMSQPPTVQPAPTSSIVCDCCLGSGHFSRKCPGRIVCYKCFFLGHKAKECGLKDELILRLSWVQRKELAAPVQCRSSCLACSVDNTAPVQPAPVNVAQPVIEDNPLAALSDTSLSGPLSCCFRCLELGCRGGARTDA